MPLRQQINFAAVLVTVGALVGSCSLFVDSGQSNGGVLDGGAEASVHPPPLLVPCADPLHSTDDACRTIDSLIPGTVGSGVVLDWRTSFGELRLEVVGGVVHGQELLLAVYRDDPIGEGGILAVDLETGARRLVTGSLGTAGGGVVSQGTGDGFFGLAGLGVSSSGKLFAILLPPFKGFSGFVLDVDAATGDRKTRSLGQTCDQVLPSELVVQPTARPAVLPDSSVYVVGQNIQAEWLIRITGEQCELVGQLPLEAGAESLVWHQGTLWMVDQFGSTLVSLDTATGKSTVVSATTASSPGLENNPIGSGHLAINDKRAFGAGGELLNAFRLVAVDRMDGTRKVLSDAVGPARTVPKRRQLVFVHPTRAALVLVIDGAVVVYDPETGNNNVISF